MALALLVAGLVAVVVVVITRFWLRGSEDLTRYDLPLKALQNPGAPASPEHAEVVADVRALFAADGSGPREEQLRRMREAMDEMGATVSLVGVELRSVAFDGFDGEWVLASGADPARRLLYLHGGGFTAGSTISHRLVTSELGRVTGCAVLAINYRLLPEHGRLQALDDCETAYRWMLENGPTGPAPVEEALVAGDSAGGNLTLALLARARDDEAVRPPDAAIALSPTTDGTFSAPSLARNLDTDPMLGPVMARLVSYPRQALWFLWFANRLRPCDVRISPIHGPLHELPPTLVHASEAEMLLDDARRYANKARLAGSEVTLATWGHMVHVWHLFARRLPEADAAFRHIGEWLAEVRER